VVLLADNLLFLLVGWEVATLMLFLLFTMGNGESRYAAGKSFVMIGASDAALLLGIVLVWRYTGTLQISEIIDKNATLGVIIGKPYAYVMFLLLLVGALTKAGAMPFHSWVPYASNSVPTPLMAFLPGALDKLMGIYLLARISLYMFQIGPRMRFLMMAIGGVTILLAVIMALTQKDVRKLLAFCAVSQVGYMVLGVATGTAAGILGALFHMLNHAVYKSCLFLGAGAVEKRTGRTKFEDLGGLAHLMPLAFITFVIAGGSMCGVPPFSGFASKWLVYQGLIDGLADGPQWLANGKVVFLVVAMFGSALTLAAFVKAVHSIFLGRKPDDLGEVQRTGPAMGVPLVVLAILCVIFGVFAQWPVGSVLVPAVQSALSIDAVKAGVAIEVTGGLWSPGLATILMLIGLAVGLLLYYLGKALKVRTTTPFTGGEKYSEEETRMAGTGFYDTIDHLKPFEGIYHDAEEEVYDLYVLGGEFGKRIVEFGRKLHNGTLSRYVAFCVVGLGVLLFILIR
jgi:formate hydrogenlyase subunit 3/multisubunit Na+/H+ antiporter MnhD subunit